MLGVSQMKGEVGPLVLLGILRFDLLYLRISPLSRLSLDGCVQITHKGCRVNKLAAT